jgi:phospholipid/cholesterol/gamma-HCH transport system substrate-binding protein
VKYANELKVGLAVIVTAAIFYFGLRFFKDIPLFKGTYDLQTLVSEARGLIPGNAVRVQGVKVGAVKDVRYDQSVGRIRIVFQVNGDLLIPKGSRLRITGIDALGDVRIEIDLAEMSGDRIMPGDVVPAIEEENNFFDDITVRAPLMADKVDSVLTGLSTTAGGLGRLVTDEESDLLLALASLRGGAASLEAILGEERDRLGTIIREIEETTSNLSTLTSENKDSLTVAVSNLTGAMRNLDASAESLSSITSQADDLLRQLNSKEGTLGLLINDPGLYHQLDSLTLNLNRIMTDFRANPRKYLREMKIELF